MKAAPDKHCFFPILMKFFGHHKRKTSDTLKIENRCVVLKLQPPPNREKTHENLRCSVFQANMFLKCIYILEYITT